MSVRRARRARRAHRRRALRVGVRVTVTSAHVSRGHLIRVSRASEHPLPTVCHRDDADACDVAEARLRQRNQ